MVQGATWQLQEAKAKLSEVVRRARSEGPQTITVHGEAAVVVMDRQEYERVCASKAPRPQSRFGRTLTEILLNAPKLDMSDKEIDEMFARNRTDFGRDFSFDD